MAAVCFCFPKKSHVELKCNQQLACGIMELLPDALTFVVSQSQELIENLRSC